MANFVRMLHVSHARPVSHSAAMADLRLSEANTDVVLIGVGGVRLFAHEYILSERLPRWGDYFGPGDCRQCTARLRDSSCPRDAPDKLQITLAETSAAAIRCLLDLVYTGQTLMPSYEVEDECIAAFEMFGVRREAFGLEGDDRDDDDNDDDDGYRNNRGMRPRHRGPCDLPSTSGSSRVFRCRFCPESFHLAVNLTEHVRILHRDGNRGYAGYSVRDAGMDGDDSDDYPTSVGPRLDEREDVKPIKRDPDAPYNWRSNITNFSPRPCSLSSSQRTRVSLASTNRGARWNYWPAGRGEDADARLEEEASNAETASNAGTAAPAASAEDEGKDSPTPRATKRTLAMAGGDTPSAGKNNNASSANKDNNMPSANKNNSSSAANNDNNTPSANKSSNTQASNGNNSESSSSNQPARQAYIYQNFYSNPLPPDHPDHMYSWGVRAEKISVPPANVRRANTAASSGATQTAASTTAIEVGNGASSSNRAPFSISVDISATSTSSATVPSATASASNPEAIKNGSSQKKDDDSDTDDSDSDSPVQCSCGDSVPLSEFGRHVCPKSGGNNYKPPKKKPFNDKDFK